jgi:hypothetical protein
LTLLLIIVVFFVQKDVAERLWGRVERLKVWELPSTDYSRDLSDDLYHLGASVVLLRERRSFAHQVPIGVAVRVPTCVASKEHMLTFYHFVTETCRDVEQLSGVTVPNAVALRWKARLALMGRRDNVPDED